MTAPARPLVIGCGVLDRELRWLAAFVGLPLEWADVALDHLEAVMEPLLRPRAPGR